MFKFYSTVVLVLAAAVGAHGESFPTASGKSCVVTPGSSNHQTDLLIDGRHVTIVGWHHIDPLNDSKEEYARGLNIAAQAAADKKCDLAAATLQKIVVQGAQDLQRSLDVQTQLNQIQKRFEIESIGVEFSPEEVANDNLNLANAYYNFQFIRKACGTRLDELVKKVASIIAGPVTQFSHSVVVPPVIQGLESQQLKNEGYGILKAMNTSPDVDQSQLSPETKRRLAAYIQKWTSGLTILDSDIELVIAAQTPTPANLREGLQLIRDLSELAFRRNNVISKNIMDGSGNYVVVIGSAHVPDLTKDILSACIARTSDEPTPSNSSNASDDTKTATGVR